MKCSRENFFWKSVEINAFEFMNFAQINFPWRDSPRRSEQNLPGGNCDFRQCELSVGEFRLGEIGFSPLRSFDCSLLGFPPEKDTCSK